MSEIQDQITSLGLIKNQLSAIDTNLSLIKGRYVGGVPETATATYGCNTTVVSSTTAVAVLENAVTDQSIFVTQVEIYNSAASTEVVTLGDSAETQVVLWKGVVPIAGSRQVIFDPPAKIAAGLNFVAADATTNGRVTVSMNGYVG